MIIPAQRARWRDEAVHALNHTSPANGAHRHPSRVIDLVDALDAAEAERDAALARIEKVREVHAPEVITGLIEGDCATEDCEHEDSCPTTGSLNVCAECFRVADTASRYYGEEGFDLVAYPCPTVQALDGEVE